MAVTHVPVLLDEVMASLAPHAGGAYVDCTVGNGGHAAGILRASGPDGRLLGLDADPDAIVVARENLAEFGDRVTLVQANFRELTAVAARHRFAAVDGILFDLGLSSRQLADDGRGFSFAADAPLDMRFDPRQGVPAAAVVNGMSAEELADILFTFGEEHQSRRLARAIVRAREVRPILTSGELAALIATVKGGGGRLHPATRTFQALRIYVNGELASLEAALPQALALLRPGGVMAVIAFHSLEDRLVKRFFQRESAGCVCPPGLPVCTCGHRPLLEVVTRKPMVPSAEEERRNRRSRSARLRVARKLSKVQA